MGRPTWDVSFADGWRVQLGQMPLIEETIGGNAFLTQVVTVMVMSRHGRSWPLVLTPAMRSDGIN